jgi:transposase
MVYFQTEHFLPYTRLTRISQALYGQPLSEATVVAAQERTYVNLATFEQAVGEQLLLAASLHADETGLRVAGRLHWLHVLSNAHLTFYGVHPKRGTEAMHEFGLLPRYRHCLVHDHLKAYFTFEQALHFLCNEHHLRELKFLAEEEHEPWAAELSRFLLDLNQRRKTQGVLGQGDFKKVLAQYHALLAQGRRRHPGQEGRRAQSKAANLLTRLEDFDLNVLGFAIFEEVPFTNNQAEQDIRMQKVQQKVSGCFRTLHGAKVFARIRSYISTCRKQGRHILDALEKAVVGAPFIPSAPPAGP